MALWFFDKGGLATGTLPGRDPERLTYKTSVRRSFPMKQFSSFAVFFLLILVLAPDPALAFRNPPATSRLFIATVTAYSSSRSARTASGTRASDGIAACPRKYPFGTKVVIEGRTYECRDRLNRKYDDRFDIWKPTRTAARLFGKRQRFVAAVIPANPIFVLAGGPQVRLARY